MEEVRLANTKIYAEAVNICKELAESYFDSEIAAFMTANLDRDSVSIDMNPGFEGYKPTPQNCAIYFEVIAFDNSGEHYKTKILLIGHENKIRKVLNYLDLRGDSKGPLFPGRVKKRIRVPEVNYLCRNRR